jgi:hypothetical protein
MSYIGQGLGQGQAERFVFTAAGGETSVTLDDSGRGVAYTVGQVDVYLNGVKLVNGTDFTATTGSSITGLSALSASDVVEIVALDAFSPADTVSAASGGTFTGNVDFDGTVDIAGATTTADVTSTKSAAAVSTLNRTTSDGDIQVFKKDGTTVGSIGSDSANGGIYIDGGSSATGLRFGTGGQIVPRRANADSDTNTDLGTSTNRFRNILLSGGIYLGGTGAANYLDDYEEGTFTPTLSASGYTFSHASQIGLYTKVGNLVTVKLYMTVSYSSGSGTATGNIYGLPFQIGSSQANYGGGSWYPDIGSQFFSRTGVVRTQANNTYLRIGNGFGGSALQSTFDWSTMPSGMEFEISAQYFTD